MSHKYLPHKSTYDFGLTEEDIKKKQAERAASAKKVKDNSTASSTFKLEAPVTIKPKAKK